MDTVVLLPGCPLEPRVADLRLRHAADRVGRPLSPHEEKAIRHASARCLRFPLSLARTTTYVGLDRGTPVSYVDCVRHFDHVTDCSWLHVNAYTLPSHRAKGFVRGILEHARERTGLQNQDTLVPDTDTARAVLGKLHFATPGHLCVEQTFEVPFVARMHRVLDTRPSGMSFRDFKGYRITVAGPEDLRVIETLQQRLDHVLCRTTRRAQMHHGILTVLNLLCPDLFYHGAFFCLRRGEQVVGTAKAFAEFVPHRNRVVWFIRHIVIDPKHCGKGLLRPFVAGVVGMASHLLRDDYPLVSPVVVRSYVADVPRLVVAFQKAGFHPVHRVVGERVGGERRSAGASRAR